MKPRLVLAAVSGLLALGLGVVFAHPHFNKTVTAKLPSGAEATVTYQTVPANENHAANAAVGSFLNPRRPRLKLSADITAGGLTVAAGEYVIGVVKNSNTDYTLALHPGDIPRGAAPDMAKLIKLESWYSTTEGKADHMLLDITPGKGKFEGKAVLTLHFGTMFLAGAIS